MIRLTERQFARLKKGQRIDVRTKFGAKPKTVDGIKFQSTHEANHYAVLKLRQKVGEIRDLATQVPFRLVVNDLLVCIYVADFTYYEMTETGQWTYIIEDTKSEATRRSERYRIKFKLMKALGWDIREVMSRHRLG